MATATYLVHLELMDTGTFIITVPKLPGCRATADTFEQALDVAQAAIEKHIKAVVKAGKAIPVESREVPPFCVHVQVAVPRVIRELGSLDDGHSIC